MPLYQRLLRYGPVTAVVHLISEQGVYSATVLSMYSLSGGRFQKHLTEFVVCAQGER